MPKFTVEIEYHATYTTVVEAEDEMAALGLARQEADEADINDFEITNETDSKVIFF